MTNGEGLCGSPLGSQIKKGFHHHANFVEELTPFYPYHTHLHRIASAVRRTWRRAEIPRGWVGSAAVAGPVNDLNPEIVDSNEQTKNLNNLSSNLSELSEHDKSYN